jgi:hypothetical protein
MRFASSARIVSIATVLAVVKSAAAESLEAII